MDAVIASLTDMASSFAQHLISSIFLGLLPIGLIGAIVGLLSIFSTARSAGPVDRRIIFAFAMVGATTGVMIGSSRSPIINVALPALLTLISTFLTYLYAKEKPSKEALDLVQSLQSKSVTLEKNRPR